MRRFEIFRWPHLACLCLVLLGLDARASISMVQEARPTAAAAAGPHSSSSDMDSMPCISCDVALAPPASKEWFDTRLRPVEVPLRIAFCRWRD